MFKCGCGREFKSQNSISRHSGFCKLNGYIKKKQPSKYKINDNLYKCECEREFTNSQSLLAHFGHCLLHREGKQPVERFGESRSWSKGLTKENDERVAKSSETLKIKIASGEYVPHCTPHSEETKNHLSEVRTKLLENNESHCKWYSVFNGEKEIKVQGTWEQLIAQTLTNLNIKWERKTILYNKIKRYTPDFYLPDYDLFLEVKGWWRDRDIEKTKIVLNEHKIDLRVIDSYTQIKEIKATGTLNINELKECPYGGIR